MEREEELSITYVKVVVEGKGRDKSTERCSVQQQWLVCIIVFIAIFIMFVLF